MSYEKGLDSYVNVQGEEWFDPCPYACNSCDHLILIGVVEECWNLESLVCQLGVVFVEFLEKRFDNPSCLGMGPCFPSRSSPFHTCFITLFRRRQLSRPRYLESLKVERFWLAANTGVESPESH